MELNELLEKRKSIRKYKTQKIAHEDLVELIHAASLAPSWKNFQTTRYYVIESEEMLEKVKACLGSYNQVNVKDAPCLIVTTVIKDKSGFNKDGSQNNELANEWGFYDAGLGCMNILLKASELGLGTLVMGIRDADMIRTTLSIPENEMIGAIIGVGYPDIDPDRPIRKDIKDISIFI